MTWTLEKYADSFVESAQSLTDEWDRVRQKHDSAMAVRDIEDCIAVGRIVIERCIKRFEQWHHWVSRDASRYDERAHSAVKDTERKLLAVSVTILRIINDVQDMGYEVDGEMKFRKAYRELRSRSSVVIAEPHLSESVMEAGKEADKNELETCENPWLLD